LGPTLGLAAETLLAEQLLLLLRRQLHLALHKSAGLRHGEVGGVDGPHLRLHLLLQLQLELLLLLV